MDMLFLIGIMPIALLAGTGVLLAVMVVRFTQARSRGNTDGAWLTAPMVLGTTGGALGFIIALVIILSKMNVMEESMEGANWASVIPSLAGLAGGIAGIVSSALVKRHRKAAGVIMLAGAALSLITIFGPMLLICGGVLALVPMKAVKEPGEGGGL